MHRVDTTTAVGQMPAPAAAGTPGYFSEGDPGQGYLATVPGQDWFNSIQEEIVNAILAGGVTLNKTKNNQLIEAIRKDGYLTDTGSANTYVVSFPVAISAHIAGGKIRFKAANANTGASTVAINSLSAVAIKRPGGNALLAGDIVANQVVELVYDGTYYQLMTANVYGSSLNTSGWHKFSSGMIMQWGTVSLGSGGGQSFSFPITFPNAALLLIGGEATADSTGNLPGGGTLSTSGITDVNPPSAGTYNYFVIGY